MLAVNIGYSPRHAGLSAESKRSRRRLQRTVAASCALALLGAGAVYGVLRVSRQPIRPSAAGRAVDVYALAGLGLREPADLTGAGHHMWITNSAGNSVTELGWGRGGRPIVRKGSNSGFLVPGAITSGGGHLWVADLAGNTITELRSDDGTVVRVIRHVGAPHSLLLFGNRLWVANPVANAVYLINALTGERLRAFRHDGLGYPSALAVSHRLLFVADESKGTITVMDAVTGA